MIDKFQTSPVRNSFFPISDFETLQDSVNEALLKMQDNMIRELYISCSSTIQTGSLNEDYSSDSITVDDIDRVCGNTPGVGENS